MHVITCTLPCTHHKLLRVTDVPGLISNSSEIPSSAVETVVQWHGSSMMPDAGCSHFLLTPITTVTFQAIRRGMQGRSHSTSKWITIPLHQMCLPLPCRSSNSSDHKFIQVFKEALAATKNCDCQGNISHNTAKLRSWLPSMLHTKVHPWFGKLSSKHRTYCIWSCPPANDSVHCSPLSSTQWAEDTHLVSPATQIKKR